jgi:hypothetical protein
MWLEAWSGTFRRMDCFAEHRLPTRPETCIGGLPNMHTLPYNDKMSKKKIYFRKYSSNNKNIYKLDLFFYN